MDLLTKATELAAQGFHVFPLCPESKLPAIKDFPNVATYDQTRVAKWWRHNPNYNIGISTSRFNGSEALLAVDVDNKGKKKGDDEILRLELEGKSFPETFEQRTPSGGHHLIYRTKEPVRQGTNVLGLGLDIRSRGGYLVGAGSVLATGRYSALPHEIAVAPDWIVDACGKPKLRADGSGKVMPGIEPERAALRATRYLLEDAKLAKEGEGGDQTTYEVACRVMDFGCDMLSTLELMEEHWNPRCEPPWHYDDLARKVENAKRYRLDPIGSGSPDTAFDEVKEVVDLSPVAKLNLEYAYVGGSKGYVIRETKDARGRFELQHIDVNTFHNNEASNKQISADGKPQQVSRLWFKDPNRRKFEGLCFMPGQEAPPTHYNLWRGFAVDPKSAVSREGEKAVEDFLEHCEINVAPGHSHWLLQYFAHMVQRPWEKPLVALVLRGKKGTGKNVAVETVGHLFGSHFAVTSKADQVLGRFNSLLENKVFLVMDEAFWSGDKRIEGSLKDLITGQNHQIERKGIESYPVDNCLRVAILGNEEWVVPASADERRFAVFDVGEGRFQDRKFFKGMMEGMRSGGYSKLLHLLQRYDISDFEIGSAPQTEGLLQQKSESLLLSHQWWLECLKTGVIEDSGYETWPVEPAKHRIRQAFERYTKSVNTRARIPSAESFTKELTKCLPTLKTGQRRIEGARQHTYRLPTLAMARTAWEKFIGHKINWPAPIEDEGDLFE